MGKITEINGQFTIRDPTVDSIILSDKDLLTNGYLSRLNCNIFIRMGELMKENNLPVSLNLTEEQEAIIASSGDIRINAVAGSGKTTTIIQYAASRPKTSKILYLAFNKSVRMEAKKRFQELGLNNVQVETAHSLAYKHIVVQKGYKVCQSSYKTYELAELLGLQGIGERHGEYILANHISKFITYFCNSIAAKVQDLHYLDIVFDEKARVFVHSFYKHIE
jgi:superfamily I DNA and RNA helicase